MTARIKVTGGYHGKSAVYKGKTPETIIRRIFGSKARLEYSRDPNCPYLGIITTPALDRSRFIEAEVVWIEEDESLGTHGTLLS